MARLAVTGFLVDFKVGGVFSNSSIAAAVSRTVKKSAYSYFARAGPNERNGLTELVVPEIHHLELVLLTTSIPEIEIIIIPTPPFLLSLALGLVLALGPGGNVTIRPGRIGVGIVSLGVDNLAFRRSSSRLIVPQEM